MIRKIAYSANRRARSLGAGASTEGMTGTEGILNVPEQSLGISACYNINLESRVMTHDEPFRPRSGTVPCAAVMPGAAVVAGRPVKPLCLGPGTFWNMGLHMLCFPLFPTSHILINPKSELIVDSALRDV